MQGNTKHNIMYILWGEWFTGGKESTDLSIPLASVIMTDKNMTRELNVPGHGIYYSHWFDNDANIKQHYLSASVLLPIGSMFILAVVVLLMVLFKRCPNMVAAIAAGLLATMIIFLIMYSVKQTPIYS